MRQGQNPKRARGRGRRPQNSANRTFDSNGPDVKIRGTASHIHEKYLALGRDAQASGDRVAAENYFQHAEHYYRIVAAAQQQQQTAQAEARSSANGASRGGEASEQSQPAPAQEEAGSEVKADAASEAAQADDSATESKPRRRSGGRRRKPMQFEGADAAQDATSGDADTPQNETADVASA